eukprot:SAG11_NODE_7257_length_1171_cov_3.940299_1_plen_128_part_00
MQLWTLLDGVTPLLLKLVLGIAAISVDAVCGCIAGVLGSDCTVQVARAVRQRWFALLDRKLETVGRLRALFASSAVRAGRKSVQKLRSENLARPRCTVLRYGLSKHCATGALEILKGTGRPRIASQA